MSERDKGSQSTQQRPAQQAPVEQPMTGSEVTPMMMLPAHEYKARMQAKVFADAEKITSKETVPGGAYVVEGQWVDANGVPLKEAPKDADTGDDDVETASADDIKAYHENQPTISNESPEARDVREKASRSR